MSAWLRKEELRWWQMSKAAHISCSRSIRQNLLPPITCHVSVVGCRHTWHFSLCSQPGLNCISHSKACWWKIYLFNVYRHGIIFGLEILAHDVNQMLNLKKMKHFCCWIRNDSCPTCVLLTHRHPLHRNWALKRSFCRTTILGIILADVTITNYRILSYMKCAWDLVLAFLELFAVCVNSRDPPDHSSLLAAVKWGQCVGLVSDTNLSLSNLKKYIYAARLYILLVLPILAHFQVYTWQN